MIGPVLFDLFETPITEALKPVRLTAKGKKATGCG
jgi:hypothetical protein